MRISTDFVNSYDSSPPTSATLSTSEAYNSEASFCSTASNNWDSSASTMSSSPPENSALFPMTPVNMFEMDDHHMPYMTPVTGALPAHPTAEYEFSTMDTMYQPMVPDIMNNPPPLPFYEHSSSPLTATPPHSHSQSHFVVPSQTLHDVYNSSPCRPAAPPFESPLSTSMSMNASPIKFFMSPDGTTPPHRSQMTSSKPLPQSVLDASSALHRLDSSPRIRKPAKKGGSGCDVVHIPKSVYKCTFPGCSEKDGKPRRFKRQEHLKRHMRIHTGGAKQTCQFCSKGFDVERSDNYRQHLKLHAEPEKKGKRTRYNAEAKVLLEKFQREKMEGRQAKLQDAIHLKDNVKKEGHEDPATQIALLHA